MNIQKLKDQLFLFKVGPFIADTSKVFSTGVEINPVLYHICLQWKRLEMKICTCGYGRFSET